MDYYAHAYPIWSRIRGYRRLSDMLYSLRNFDENEIARQRLKIIGFYETYGEKATREAFGADRKVISRWKKRLRENSGRIEALIPLSTRPKKKRTSQIPYPIISFIRDIRKTYPRLGKEKIKPLLDAYCRKQHFSCPSESTIGNIIRRNHFFFQGTRKIYHNPDAHRTMNRIKQKRAKVRHSPKPVDFGYIISDTVERITDGIKDYFYSAMDIKSRLALTLRYKRLSSRNMRDFYRRFNSLYPGEIKTWQSDNGCENLGEFDLQLKKEGILHLFSYPRCPKINAYIERYNRTIQEEFIDNHLDTIHDKELFSRQLADYLIFYNTQRVHKSLGNRTPVDYLIEQGVLSQMCLTYTLS
jgi:transposase InsO family protein